MTTESAVVGADMLQILSEELETMALQLADVIANSFFTRALPGDRQARMSAIVTPMMEAGRIKMRILAAEPHGEDEDKKHRQRGHSEG
jgi:hypothetical protein